MQPQPRDADGFITVQAAAERAGLSVSRVRDWYSSGWLRFYREGRRVYVSVEDLRAVLRSRAQRRTQSHLRLVIDNT